MRTSIGYTLAVLVVLTQQAAKAADFISWGAATNISGDSDVDTTGALVLAYNLGTSSVSSTTVNGVLFSAWGFPANGSTNTTTNGSATLTETTVNFKLVSFSNLGTGTGSFSGLSSDYQTLLGSGGSSNNPTSIDLTVTGLTVGVSYRFQWWANNSSLVTNGGPMLLTSSNSRELNANVGTSNGNLGQYTIGTFTAFSSSLLIHFTAGAGSSAPLINAFQLRVVPEPSTWVMGGLATSLLAGSGLRMRRQKKN
ncbi:MAG: hypothetical protein GC190_19805 [Alphaproteobacteria bacterium]|nr:hypothetical protein [Alphaproteobacteria bacterium]